MKIESIRLKNYKVFRDIHLKAIPSFLVVVGANGSGKSTLFDVFGFLHDCLKGNVRQALDSRGRFREVLSRDALNDTILIEIQYRMLITGVERLVAAEVAQAKAESEFEVFRRHQLAAPSRAEQDFEAAISNPVKSVEKSRKPAKLPPKKRYGS